MVINIFDSLVIIATLGTFATYALRRRRASLSIPLPPGPPQRLLLGNIPDMPMSNEKETYDAWHAQYGDLVYLNLAGKHMILVNSYEAAFDLFERRSSIYSDRPSMKMVNEYAGFAWSPSTMAYGPEWRHNRMFLHRKFHPSACDVYLPIQEKWSDKLLERLAKDPSDPCGLIKHHVGALMMEIAYGIKVQDEDDPWITLCEEVVEIFSCVTQPGAFLVDLIPLVAYIPEWMPGGAWKKQARIWKKTVTRLADEPFDHVRQCMFSGKEHMPSVVADLLIEYTSPEDAVAIRNVGAIIYAAGTDTTAAILHVFLLAMILHPNYQRKAQAEIDAVIGGERLPTLLDRPNLPYTEALLKEVYRWHPIQPLNGPHVTTQDDIYRGYLIPKGTSVHSNNWALLRHPDLYGPDPETFRPERFLSNTPPRNPSFVFGLGRRACPGRFFADNTIFIIAARLLATFTVEHPIQGRPVVPKFKRGFFSTPEPFECSLVARQHAKE